MAPAPHVAATLADIVRAQGPFGADEAALIGREVCLQLSAIHRKGRACGRISPERIYRTSGGRISLAETAPPAIRGGSPPSSQSDLHAVVALLHFLTTGAPPHEGKIGLRDQRPDLPQPFIQVLDRALAQSPRDRFQNVEALAAELGRLVSGVESSGPVRGARAWPAIAGGALIVALGLSTWAMWPSVGVQRVPERFALPLDGHLTIPQGYGSRQFSLSADGSTLVYSTMSLGRAAHILVRRLDELQSLVVENAGDAGQPFIAPDGRTIGFHASGTLRTIALSAGARSVNLLPLAGAGGASWGPDGRIVYSSEGNLWRISETGGSPERLTAFDAITDQVAIRPQVLPTGDVLFTARGSGGTGHQVAVLTRDGRSRTLVTNATGGQFLPPGYLVYVAGNPPAITAVPFDLPTLRITGQPVALERVAAGSHWFTVAPNGTLVFSEPVQPATAELPRLVWVDRKTGTEQPLRLPLLPGQFLAQSLRLSPDGRKLAIARTPDPLIETVDGPVPGILQIGDLETGEFGRPLTTEPVRPLTFTPDSRYITYRTTEGAVVRRRADGTGTEELLARPHPDLNCSTGDWTPDGRVLLLSCGGSTAERRLGFVSLSFPSVEAVGRTPVLPERYPVPLPGLGGPRFSEDGRWFAYATNSSDKPGSLQVFVRAFPGPGPVHTISGGMGRRPVWRGRELFYVGSPLDKPGPLVPIVVATRAGSRFGFDPPQHAIERFETYDLTADGRYTFDVSPDGRRFLVLKRASGRGGDYITTLTVVLNWVEEVRRKTDGR